MARERPPVSAAVDWSVHFIYNISTMAYKCAICGKAPVSGNSYSHSHKATKRIFRPNLQKQKLVLKGAVRSALVCTRCIKSGKAPRPSK